MNHYERLKVTQDAPPEVIRAAYRALANRLHPDRSGTSGLDDGTHEQMSALNAAYEVLIDPALRRDYDARLSTARHWREPVAGDVMEDPARDLSAGGLPPDLAAPVSAWAPEMRHVAMANGALLVLATVASAWYLKSDSAASSIDVTASSQLARQEDSVAVEAARRGEMPALGWAGDSSPRRPSVAELARMTDEELVAAMPALDEPLASKEIGQKAPPRLNQSVAQVHPLDGQALSLKNDLELLGAHAGRLSARTNP